MNVLELRAKAALTSGSVLYEIWDGTSVSSIPAEIGGPFPVSGPKNNDYIYSIAQEIQLGSGEDHYIFDREYTLNQLPVNAAISDWTLTMSDTENGLGTHTLYYAVDNRGAIPGTDPDGIPDYQQPYSTVKVFYSLYDGTVGDPQPVSERENIEIATLYEKVGSAGIYIAPKTQTYHAENYVFDDILTNDEWDNKGGLSPISWKAGKFPLPILWT